VFLHGDVSNIFCCFLLSQSFICLWRHHLCRGKRRRGTIRRAFYRGGRTSTLSDRQILQGSSPDHGGIQAENSLLIPKCILCRSSTKKSRHTDRSNRKRCVCFLLMAKFKPMIAHPEASSPLHLKRRGRSLTCW